MARLKQKPDEDNESKYINDEFAFERPQVRILNDAQWLFIRKYFRISPRELEVAKLVCCGLSNDEIAKLLKIRSATVKTHLRNVYRRIHVQRKLDMLLKFLERSAKHSDLTMPGTISSVDNKTNLNSGLINKAVPQ